MREKLIEELIKEVYGPRDDSYEVIAGNPIKEYITGVIVSKKCEKDGADPDSEITESLGENSLAEDDYSDDGFTEFSPSDLDPKMRPSTFGISFVIKGDKPSFKICVTWGMYHREDDNKWKRTPYGKIVNVSMDKNEDIKKISVYNDGDKGDIDIHIKRIYYEEYQTIHVNMVNNLTISDCKGKEFVESSIFQPSIRIIMQEGTIIDTALTLNESSILHFLYRKRPVLARGHMCSAIWKEIDYADYIEQKVMWPDGYNLGQNDNEYIKFLECDVRSEFVPLYPDASSLFDWDNKWGEGPELSASKLSEMWDKHDVENYLDPLIKGYSGWIEKNKNEDVKNHTDEKQNISEKLIESQRMLLERMKDGIELLKKDSNVRLSFCFANRAILLQHQWKKKNKNDDFRWRPYQLAFMLMVLESLCNRNSKYRNHMDLLWIPTGGGKTEAYLALMAFIMALRRRKDGNGDKSGGGTAVITRYTLRLLTIQQFRRTLGMVTAAEYLRIMKTCKGLRGWRPSKCDISDELIFGSPRFSAGMWIGGSVSPNHLRTDGNAIDVLLGKDVGGEPAQVIRCPACGTYLSVPESGLPAGEKLYLMVSSVNIDENKIMNDILSLPGGHIKNVEIKDNQDFKTFILTGKTKLTAEEIDKLCKNANISDKILSMRASRPGYMGCKGEPGRRNKDPRDFEIFCPNPDCELNTGVNYIEGVPMNIEESLNEVQQDILPDGFIEKKGEFIFSGKRVPIPAYTVDEQIYHRCPTIIVSTADKIARLAFEPRAASIFGNVKRYNAYYGYYRDDLLPEKSTRSAEDKYVQIKPFIPPDLIIQDELHLIDGPVGSMYGLYEIIVEGIIKSNGVIPKYIASTATVRDAEIQVKRLFARKLFQFPPHGHFIDDNFFVRYPDTKEIWDEKKPGRVYMGIYAPGTGPITPQVRIWSNLLKTSNDYRNDIDIKYFWTVVGFFNAIKELGGGMAIYREDIIERIGQITQNNTRKLDPAKVIELSSRRNSTDLPQILDEMEAAVTKNLSENPDAILTTSIFGTGVDIPHLSLMVVNGQPKTTSQYIQATGRVGRTHGGLVITFLRAGRPRDLSHYEMFSEYHRRISLYVEPSSVSPFSDGCLKKASGPAMVSFFRNISDGQVAWYGDDGKVILENNAINDFNRFINIIEERVKGMDENFINFIKKYFEMQKDRWESVAKDVGKSNMVFVEYSPYNRPSKNVVLGDPYHEKSDPKLSVVYRNAPQSLRDIEETTGFLV
ncbi:MAG: DISARM system helicase DrmA [Thermoplasmata archaeon]